MKTLLERYGESWRAAGRDVTLIVASILIAFTLDAWWQGGRDRALEREHMQALVNEFRATLSQLEGQLAGLENSLDATLSILELMGTSPSAIAPSELSVVVVRSFNVGIFSPQQRTLESMLASGELGSSDRDSLSALLERWPAMANSLQVDTGHLERNREEVIFDSLVRLGVPISVLVQAGDLGVPESEFSLDTHTLLTDVGLESVFTIRAIRQQLLANDYRTAIEDVEAIIRLLEVELDGRAG